MTDPVKERGTRRNLPLHFRSAFPFPLRFRSSFLSTLRFRSARLPKFSVGKKSRTRESRRFPRAAHKLSDPGGGVCKEAPRDALATRPSAQAYRLDAAQQRFDLLRFSCISRAVLRLWQL